MTAQDYERLQSYAEFADSSLDKALEEQDADRRLAYIRSAKTEIKSFVELLERVRTRKANRR